MKKLILIVAVLATMSFSIQENTCFDNAPHSTEFSDYCDGWEDGYCEGYKDVKGQYAICPITPICPIAKIGTNNYRGGYNRGFKAGMRKGYKN